MSTSTEKAFDKTGNCKHFQKKQLPSCKNCWLRHHSMKKHGEFVLGGNSGGDGMVLDRQTHEQRAASRPF